MPTRLTKPKSRILIAGLALAIWPSDALHADDPAAVIEAIDGAAAADRQVMEFVAPGDVIELGAAGRLVLSYLKSCRIETITGGRVTVGPGSSTVDGGAVETTDAPCMGSRLEVAQSQQEAAGAVYRVAAFDGQDWGERTISSDRPIFQWSADSGSGLASVVVLDMDRDPPAIVWRGVSDRNTLAWPEEAPPLEIGVPYQVQITIPGAPQLVQTFSIDPGLEGPETVLSRLVPVAPRPEPKQ